jgi:hypothetical protein
VSGYSGLDGIYAGLRLWFDNTSSDMTIPTVVYTDLTWTNSGTNDFVTSPGGTFLTDGWVAGRKVRVTGASVVGNNGTWNIKTVTATVITFTSVATITSDSDVGVSVTFTTDRETLTRITTVGVEQDESIALISTDGDVSIDNYCTVSGVPGAAVIPAGLFEMQGYFWVSATGARVTTAKFTVRSVTTAGVITQHGTSSTATITATSNATATKLIMQYVNSADIAIATTDRIIVRVQFNANDTTSRTAHFIYQGSTRPAYIDTPFNVTAPQGASGYSGISGYSGYSGISGYSGYSGISGYSGYSGKSGYSGYSGISGYSGYSGYSGISGYSGYSGTSGYSGYSGKSGYSGYSGISGYSGYSGISGYSGYSGISGYSGYSGKSGYSGYSGISGYSGTSGYSGQWVVYGTGAPPAAAGYPAGTVYIRYAT